MLGKRAVHVSCISSSSYMVEVRSEKKCAIVEVHPNLNELSPASHYNKLDLSLFVCMYRALIVEGFLLRNFIGLSFLRPKAKAIEECASRFESHCPRSVGSRQLCELLRTSKCWKISKKKNKKNQPRKLQKSGKMISWSVPFQKVLSAKKWFFRKSKNVFHNFYG